MRKKGLVERILMKDPASEDFSYQKFPKNRKELFLYMIKNKLWKIYQNHWFMALFFLPLIAWGVLTLDYTNMVFSLDPREGITHLVEYWVTVYVTAIPLWTIAFVGIAGGLNVIRKLAWSDPVIIKTDFLQGIKASGKQMAFIGFFFGASYAVVRYAIDWLGFYYRVFDDSYSSVFGIFVSLFLLVVLVGFTVYMSCMSCIYNVNLKQLFVGAFKLYVSDFFLATGIIVLSFSPIVLLMIAERAITVLFVYLFIFCLLIGFMVIPAFLVCHHTFDRIINKKDYPSYYGRGLSYGTYEDKKAEMDDVESAKGLDDSCDKSDKVENDFERVDDE